MKSLIVVLDMDGVVIDTIPGLYKIFQEFLSFYGKKATFELFSSYNGVKIEAFVEDLKNRFSIPTPLPDLITDYSTRMKASYEHATVMSGCREFLEYCQSKEIPVCLATGSKRENVERLFSKFDLKKYFSLIIAGDEVKCGKPDPETYEKIKQHYGDRTYIVIDDSPLGLEGATKAGMKTFLFSSETLQSSYTVISGFSEIPFLITAFQLQSQIVFKVKDLEVQKAKDLFLDTFEVSQHWNEILQKNSNAFNGKFSLLWSIEETSKDKLTLWYAESDFKTFAYLSKERKLPIISISVSGIVTQEKKLLLGKRANWVKSYPGYLEFPPSGNLEPHNTPSEQLIKELSEETGITQNQIDQMVLKGLIYDEDINCLDIVFHMEISSQPPSTSSKEYEWLSVISKSEIESTFFDKEIVPTSEKILKHFL